MYANIVCKHLSRDKFNTECILAESSPPKEHRVRKPSTSSPTKEVIDHTTTNVKGLTISTQYKGKTRSHISILQGLVFEQGLSLFYFIYIFILLAKKEEANSMPLLFE